jgi:hypothetical protein
LDHLDAHFVKQWTGTWREVEPSERKVAPFSLLREIAISQPLGVPSL